MAEVVGGGVMIAGLERSCHERHLRSHLGISRAPAAEPVDLIYQGGRAKQVVILLNYEYGPQSSLFGVAGRWGGQNWDE